jgi:hypothetical protein
MKKIISAALLTLAVGGASAQGYVGGTFGVSNLDADCSGTTSCDNNGSAFKIYGGYNFNRNVGIEGGYLDFGKASASGYPYGYLTNIELKTHALFVAAVVRGDFTPNFGGAARLGVAAVKSSVDHTVSSFGAGNWSSSSAKAYFGLSLDYAFTKGLKGVAAADFTTTDMYDQTGAVRMFTLGLQYDF